MQMFLPTIRRLFMYSLPGLCLFHAGCKHSDPDPLQDLSADQISVVQALNKVILPIQNADPNRDFSELAPLDTVLAKAKVVGMGEGTHGTREFFQMKDRLFRYLVQKFGHQAIAFEANFGRAVIVNRFIHGHTTNLASAATAAKSMYFWTWSTDEVRELLQWMKDYNAGKSSSQQLSFYGFDCQYADDEFPLLTEFLTKSEPSLISQIDSLASQYKLVGSLAATNAGRQQYAQRLTSLYNLFVANEGKWVATGGRESYEIARQAARILVQQQDLGDVGSCNSFVKRDQYMAENVQWLLTRMNINKLSLWAHNGHVANNAYYNCDQPSMGAYLKQQFKNNYLVVGTSLTNGSFTVRDASQDNAPLQSLSIRTEGIKASANYLLGKAQYANFVLNVNQSQSDATLTNWLAATHPLFEVGAAYDESRSDRYYTIATLKSRYDLLIHFRDTTPSQLLP